MWHVKPAAQLILSNIFSSTAAQCLCVSY